MPSPDCRPLRVVRRRTAGRRRPDPAALDEGFGELDGIRRRALAEVVADDPEGDAAVVLDREVLPDAPDEDLVAARGLGGQRVLVARRVVLDDDARRRRRRARAPDPARSAPASRRGRPPSG